MTERIDRKSLEAIPSATLFDYEMWRLAIRDALAGRQTIDRDMRIIGDLARQVARLNDRVAMLARQLDTAIMEREDLRGKLDGLPARCESLVAEVARLKALHEPIADSYACYRCGRRDGLDACVANEIWAKLSQGKLLTVEVVDARWPILCLWCMDELASQLGIQCSASLHFAGRGLYGTSDSEANIEHVSRLVAEVTRLTAELARCPNCGYQFDTSNPPAAMTAND